MFNPMYPCDVAAPAGCSQKLSRSLPTGAIASRLCLWGGLLLATLLSVPVPAWATDLSTVPLPTYSTGSSVAVKPNILMVLDDSGSMDWDYLPDWANDTPPNYSSLPAYFTKNSSFNGVAYNPAITYLPPVGFNADGTKDTTTRPSMRGTSATTGADMSFATPNWRAVKNDGFGVQATGTTNLTAPPQTRTSRDAGDTWTDWRNVQSCTADASGDNRVECRTVGGPWFHATVAGEYCDSPAMTNCTATATPSGKFAYPAPLRWCNSSALTTCRALQDSTFRYPRMPAPRVATLTFASSNNAVITGITIDGLQIMSGSTSSSSTNSTVAASVHDKINDCSYTTTGNCTTVGYIAKLSGSTVTIFAPGTTTGTPTAAKTGTVTITAAAFAQVSIPASPYLRSGYSASSAAVPGENLLTVIIPSITSYPYPGSNVKAAGRSDCAGTTCTYAEEMTNYANWWAYYRTRMQMMKTSTSRAFSTLDKDADIAAGRTSYRVGYMSINNNTGSDFANITDFDAAQKVTWFSKLFNANPNNSTPLRAALATAGRVYAGKYNGQTLNGTTVTDPLQFSCQKNFTILSTDGFWNGSAGVKLDGSTAIGNQDGLLPRPYNDGASAQNQTRTSQLQQRTDRQQAQKGTLQKQTSQLQIQTAQLQANTRQLQQRTQSLQTRTYPLQTKTQNLQTRTQNLQTRTQPLQTRATPLEQRTGTAAASNNGGVLQTRTSGDNGSTWTTWSDAGSCTVDNNGSSRRQCRWVNWGGWTSLTGACAYNPAPTGSTVECRYGTPGTFADTASACTVVAQASGTTSSWPVARDCQYGALTTWSTATSCTAAPPSTGPNYTVITARSCQYDTPSSWSDVGSCTTVNASAGPTNYTVGVARQCQYDPVGSTWSDVGTCTTAGSASSPYTVSQARQCQYSPTPTAWADAASCTTNSGSPGPTNYTATKRDCQYNPTPSTWADVSSCTVSAGSPSSPYSIAQAVQCQYAPAVTSNVSSCSTIAGSSSPNYTVAQSRTCTYAAYTAWADTGSCTTLAQSGGPSYAGSATNCQTVVTSSPPFANATACSVTTPDVNGVSTQCQYSFAAAATLPGACSPVYTANDYTNATVYKNCTSSPGTWIGVSSCTATTVADASGDTTSCQYDAWTSWSNVASCTAAPQSSTSPYTVGLARECQGISSGGTSNTLADVAAYYNATDLRSPTATGADATGTCTGPIIAPATTPSDLCANNVAAYGRDTNATQHMTTHTLGLGAQGMMVFSPYQNNLAGERVFVPNYWDQVTGDFYSVFGGTTPNPTSGICSWMSTGKCTWPTPASDSSANIDDLWHAAVNGRGSYFSATDPQSLAESLKSVLNEIIAVPLPGTAAAAASSNPNVTSSDNYVFSSSYRSVEWFGELIMQELSSTGLLSDSKWSAMRLLDCATSPWQAGRSYTAGDTYSQGGACYLVNAAYTSGGSFASGAGTDGQNASVLEGGTPVTRTIYTVGTGGLVPFTWGSLTTTQKGYFETPYINYVSATQGLTQFCAAGPTCLGATAQTAAAGQALVDFLRGDRTNEGGYFRARKHVLGDIVSSEARYVKKPLLNYTDANYGAFKTAKASRAATVYVGSNDGMLHAFDALTGKENWAFVPAAVLPDMYRLADSAYATKHRFYVDGTPEVGDICPRAPGATCSATEWTTIIVGGLNGGGKAFYALDITDPANPRYLWEFTNAGLGFSYSNPRITKLRDGTWVVIVASGYNNTDGIGRLFVINASTGTLIQTIATTAGSVATPSGLARIAARAPTSATNNTVEQVYGGDVLGNVWRFDVNNTIGAPGADAQLLVTLLDSSGNPQPITAKPTVATVGNFPLVMVGTGRYLGLSDITDTSEQTMYGFQDKLNTTTLVSPRSSGSNFVRQTLTLATCPADAPASLCSQGQTVRTATSNSVDWAVKNGWYIDYVTGGERSFSDPTLALGTLVFTTVIPQTSTDDILACSEDNSSSAKSFLYYLDYLTGGAVAGAKDVGGEQICSCVSTRPSVVKSPDGSVQSLTRMSGGASGVGTDMGTTRRDLLPVNQGGPGSVRRISWRELNGE